MVDARGGSMKGCRYSGVKVSFAGLFIIINTKTFLVTTSPTCILRVSKVAFHH